MLSQNGYRVTGIEPSIRAAELARQSGLNVVTGSFPGEKMPSSFDGAVMSHVFEHIRELRSFLDATRRLIPRGILLLTQSHWKGWMPRIQGEKWHAWAPDYHFWHFTPKGLKLLLEKENWKTDQIEYSSLSHGDRILSLAGEIIPWLGDQFHLIARPF